MLIIDNKSSPVDWFVLICKGREMTYSLFGSEYSPNDMQPARKLATKTTHRSVTVIGICEVFSEVLPM